MKVGLLGIAVLALAACAPGTRSDASLVGTWTATSENARGSSFEFRPDGTATWQLGQPFEIQYRTDHRVSPTRVELSGFQVGPLKGRTLYCLIQLGADDLLMDCEPDATPPALDAQQTQAFARSDDR